jgi:NitT/TauT family transport system substrate-binding protein
MKKIASCAAHFAARTIVKIGLFALLGLATVAKAEVEHTSIAQTPAIMPFLAAYIAEDANIWRDNELDVKVIYLDGVATMNAVIAGSADFALSSSSALTRAAAHGQRLLALAAINNQSGQMTVLRKDLADAAHFDPTAPLAWRARILKGRVMAAGGVGSVADVFLRTIAKAGGVDQSELTISPIGAFELLAAFSRHAVDGFSYSLPYPLQAAAEGTAVVVADGTNGEPKELFPLAAGLLVTRPQICLDHRSLCEKMGHSILAATKFLLERKPEALAILKKRFPAVNDAVLASAFAAVTRMTQSPPSITPIALENGDLMNSEAGFLKPEDKVQSYDGLYTNEFLR